MLVVEGPDHVGKTTFCKKVVERLEALFPVYYAHMGRPPMSFNFGSDYYTRISEYAAQDRFHLGGFVYHSRLSIAQMRLISSYCRAEGGLVVAITVPPETIEEWKETIVRSGRAHDFKLGSILTHNEVFSMLAEQTGIVDFKIELKNEHGRLEFPNDSLVSYVASLWREGLEAYCELC